MVFHAEPLQLVGLLVFHNGDALVAAYAVVERGRGGLDLDGTVWDYLGGFPTALLGPVDGKHVIRKLLTEPELARLDRLDFGHVDPLNSDILGLESLSRESGRGAKCSFGCKHLLICI